ncbi:MAG: phage/plasmid primase, P4 family [Gemmataceae bacterium]
MIPEVPQPDPKAGAAWRKAAQDKLAEWSWSNLVVRADRYGGYYTHPDTGSVEKCARPKREDASPGKFNRAVLSRHFQATGCRDVVGCYALTACDDAGVSYGKWVGIDWDNHDDQPEVAAANLRHAVHVYRELVALGFHPLLVTWATGGFHLWVFIAEKVPGPILHAFGNWIVRDAERFGIAIPEVNPKQPRVKEYGNWLRAPGKHHKRDVWGIVFDGREWVQGEAAVAHILSLPRDPVELIPPDATPKLQAKPRPSTGVTASARGPVVTVRADRPDVFAAYNQAVSLDDVVAWHVQRGAHTVTARTADRVEFRREGKDDGTSFNVAVIDGIPFTKNFSTNAGMPTGPGLTPSQVRCYYERGACDTRTMAAFAPQLQKELGWSDEKSRGGDGGGGDSSQPGGGESPTGGVFDDTDVANGRHFVADHVGAALYVDDWGHWAVFDGTRWVPDKSGARIERLAKATTERMAYAAAEALGAAAQAYAAAEDEEEKKRLGAAMKAAQRRLGWAKASQDMKRVRAMLTAARSEPRVYVRFGRDRFDTHPHLLNCPNGTVDLRTGAVRPHDRNDYLTKLCPTAFNSAAKRDGYLAFLDKIFWGRPAVATYIRRLSGYVATGETCDHSAHFWWGDGSNGKSVLQLLWLEALGNTADGYAHTPPPELLIVDRSSRHPTEKVGLRGSRLAVCSETPEDARLDEQKLKALTGDDLVQARGMRQDFFEFPPTHKFVVPTNHKPHVKGSDHGIWRRLRLVPFEVKFWKETDRALDPDGDTESGPGRKYDPEFRADPGLLDRLRTEEREGVLADMVEHAARFYAEGRTLNPPPEVTRATADYRKAEDVIGQFLGDNVQADANGRIGAGELYAQFKQWWTDEGHDAKRTPSVKRFGDQAKGRFDSFKDSKVYYRIRLTTDTQTQDNGRIGAKNEVNASRVRVPFGVNPKSTPDPPAAPVIERQNDSGGFKFSG